MGEDSNNIKDIVGAVEGVAKAVPIYQDLLQPAVQEVGKGLATVAKTVHIALAPVSVMVWGYDQIKDFVSTKVADRLKDVPPENIVSPAPNVAGPALEAIKYTGHQEELSDLYANLLASSMNLATKNGAHPAFVEIIRQLTADEAKLLAFMGTASQALPVIDIKAKLKPNNSIGITGARVVYRNISLLGHKAGCELPDQAPAYLDNIARLGLIEVLDAGYTEVGVYDELVADPRVIYRMDEINADDDTLAIIERKGIFVTPLGLLFHAACVVQSGSTHSSQ